MLRWIMESLLKFRLLVAVLSCGLLVAGFMELRNHDLDVLPEFSPPYIEIQTEALGLSAAEVEQLITVPLEADLLNGVAFLDEIRSDSVPGLSSVVMLFEPGTDLYRARQLVAERMTQAHALPNVSKPPVMLEPVSSSSRTMVLQLSSDSMSLIDQSVLARWTIRPRLMGVSGVSNVTVFGERDRQLQVQVDPALLNSRGLNLLDIITTAGNATWVSPLTFLEASTPGTGGFIDTPNQRLGVQNISPIVNAETLGSVAVENHPGLRLADVANVVEDHQLLIGDGIVGENSGLTVVIEKFPDANTVAVTHGVEQAMADLAPGLGGLRIDAAIYRPASYLEAATKNLAVLLLLGFGLALLLASLFLHSWKAAVLAVVTVPLSVATAVVILDLFNIPFNYLVILGLVAALLVVVDDAVRDSAAYGLRIEGRGPVGTNGGDDSGVHAALPIRRWAVYSAIILALAVTPAFFLPGASGAFIRPAVWGYLIGLASAIAVAMAIIPGLASFLAGRPRPHLRPGHPEMKSRFSDKAELPIARLVSRVSGRARTGVGVGASLIVIGALLLPFLRIAAMPELRERELLVAFNGSAGTGSAEMMRVTAAAGTELRALPGVTSVGANIGRAVLSDQVGDINAGEIWVRIDAAADYDSTVDAVREVINGYPGLQRSVQTYLDGRSGLALEAAGSELVVRVYGEDSAVLTAKAVEVQRLMEGIDGLTAETVHQYPLKPTLQVEVDLVKAQRVQHQTGRRSTNGGDASRRHGGRQPVRAPESLRGRRLGRPGAPQQCAQRAEPAGRSTGRRRPSSGGRRGECHRRRRTGGHPAGRLLPIHRRQRRPREPQLRSGDRGAAREDRHHDLPVRAPRRDRRRPGAGELRPDGGPRRGRGRPGARTAPPAGCTGELAARR